MVGKGRLDLPLTAIRTLLSSAGIPMICRVDGGSLRKGFNYLGPSTLRHRMLLHREPSMKHLNRRFRVAIDLLETIVGLSVG